MLAPCIDKAQEAIVGPLYALDPNVNGNAQVKEALEEHLAHASMGARRLGKRRLYKPEMKTNLSS